MNVGCHSSLLIHSFFLSFYWWYGVFSILCFIHNYKNHSWSNNYETFMYNNVYYYIFYFVRFIYELWGHGNSYDELRSSLSELPPHITVRTCICVYIFMWQCVYVHVCLTGCLCVCVCVSVCVCLCVLCLCLCMCVCLCVSGCVCLC